MGLKLLLFDIDGVLIPFNDEMHAKSFSEAIKQILNVDVSMNEIKSSGKTSTRIIIEMSNRRGIPAEVVKSHMKEIYDSMTSYAKKHIDEFHIQAAPYIKEFLNQLESEGCVLGLLTGNLEEVAKLRLEKVGLWNFFQFGGFGEVSEDREKLADEALKRAEEKLKINVDKKDVFYIGDAPLDIECGRNAGIKTIAVATGIHTKEELANFKPDFLFDNFSNFQDIIKIIEGARHEGTKA